MAGVTETIGPSSPLSAIVRIHGLDAIHLRNPPLGLLRDVRAHAAARECQGHLDGYVPVLDIAVVYESEVDHVNWNLGAVYVLDALTGELVWRAKGISFKADPSSR